MIPLGVLASRRPATGGSEGFFQQILTRSYAASDVFLDVPVGTPHPDRTLVLVSYRAAANATLMSLTVDGDPGTTDLGYVGALSNRHHVLIKRWALPEGETVDVEWSSSPVGHVPAIAVYTFPVELTPIWASGTFSGQGNPSLVTGHAPGLVTLAAAGTFGSGDWAWTGAAEDDSLAHATFAQATAATITADSGSETTTGLGAVTYALA